MVNRAKSEHVKGHLCARKQEEKITRALAEYCTQQARPQTIGKPKSIQTLADEHGISYGRLHRRIQGGKSRKEASANKQSLTPAQEWSLVGFIKESASMGMPLSHRQIEEYANAAREAVLGLGCQLTHWSKPLDLQRAKSLDPAAVKSWVELVKKYVVNMGVEPDCIYRMDESGFPTGYTGKERVVGKRGTKTQHKQGGASQQNITVLVTILGDGKMVVLPMIIFLGVKFQLTWNNGNSINAFICRSLTSWTDCDLGYKWLSKVFDPATKEEANRRPWVLLLNGHSSHYSEMFLQFVRNNNMILLGYPPHCTHTLQGLDVVCFLKMKECWKRGIVAFEAKHKRNVAKADFLTVWAPAYKEAFDEKTVKAAFRVTGVILFNPNFVGPKQITLSQSTSTCGEFPMPQPSPVRRITQAMALHKPTRAEQDPDLLATPTPCSRCLCTKDDHSENESADIWTPSKKIRLLYAHLVTTSTGSLLLSMPKITSRTNPIHPPVIQTMPSALLQPDWSLALQGSSTDSWKSQHQLESKLTELQAHLKRAQVQLQVQSQMLQEANATMVFQNIALKKTNEALHLQEEQATNDRARLFEGQAQCLSSDEFFDQALRDDKKAAKAALEEQGVKIKEDHAVKVAKWEKECAEMVGKGARKKGLPAKPKCTKKPRLQEDTDDDNDDEDDGCQDES
ncbi:unnamed protein product [Mycena citricolor]|uniref:DDE-1 domain-containing protein n=1 Tax=Mycena citricolor TaxID=2018698 RepID=A0AAD2K790_9AGAR|nr:unnamed protein product [Mycena citricolor]